MQEKTANIHLLVVMGFFLHIPELLSFHRQEEGRERGIFIFRPPLCRHWMADQLLGARAAADWS